MADFNSTLVLQRIDTESIFVSLVSAAIELIFKWMNTLFRTNKKWHHHNEAHTIKHRSIHMLIRKHYTSLSVFPSCISNKTTMENGCNAASRQCMHPHESISILIGLFGFHVVVCLGLNPYR